MAKIRKKEIDGINITQEKDDYSFLMKLLMTPKIQIQ